MDPMSAGGVGGFHSEPPSQHIQQGHFGESEMGLHPMEDAAPAQPVPETVVDLTKTEFPVSRVKKIMKADRDVKIVSAEAAYLVTVATELFVEFLARAAYDEVRLDSGKARKTVKYQDLASAVRNHEELEFLDDVIPPKVSYKQPEEPVTAAQDMHMQQGVAQQTTSGQGMAQQGMAQPGMSGQGMAQQGMAQQGMAQQGMAQQGMAQQGMAQQGMAQQGMAQQGMSGQGMAQQGIQQGLAQQGMAQPGMSGQGIQQGMAQQGMAQQGLAQQGMAQQGMSGQGMAQQGMAQQGMAQQGIAQQGMAQQGMAQQGMSGQGMAQQQVGGSQAATLASTPQ